MKYPYVKTKMPIWLITIFTILTGGFYLMTLWMEQSVNRSKDAGIL